MKIHNAATLYDLFGENMVFRNLNILNKNVSQFNEIKNKLGLSSLPRKNSEDYARVIYQILQQICPGIESVFYFGDSDLDKTVIKNLHKLFSIKIAGFIFDSKIDCPVIEDEVVFLYNDWTRIAGFMTQNKALIGSNCAGLFDLDKTVIGAKGRNSTAIDLARYQAVVERIKEINPVHIETQIKEIYDTVNKDFTDLTEDNQDIIAFLTILVYFKVLDLRYLHKMLKTNKSVVDILEEFSHMPFEKGLKKVFDEIKLNYSLNQPTIFKSFRYCELITTRDKFNPYMNGADLNEIFGKEITITKEIYDVIKFYKESKMKVLCLSDKPDETIAPAPGPADSEMNIPLYFKKTKVAGNEIYKNLSNI